MGGLVEMQRALSGVVTHGGLLSLPGGEQAGGR